MNRFILLISALSIWVTPTCLYSQNYFSYDQAFESGSPELLAELPKLRGWINEENFVLGKEVANDYMLLFGKPTAEPLGEFLKLTDLPSPFSTSKLPASSAAISPDFQTYILAKEGELFSYKNNIKEFRKLTDSPSDIEKNPRFSMSESLPIALLI